MTSTWISLWIYIAVIVIIYLNIAKKRRNINNQRQQGNSGVQQRNYRGQQNTTNGNKGIYQGSMKPNMSMHRGRNGHNEYKGTAQAIDEVINVFKNSAGKKGEQLNNKYNQNNGSFTGNTNNSLNNGRYRPSSMVQSSFVKTKKKRKLFQPKDVDCGLDERIFGPRDAHKDLF